MTSDPHHVQNWLTNGRNPAIRQLQLRNAGKRAPCSILRASNSHFVFFVASGALVALSVLKPELVGRSGYFWAAAMFIAAGLLSIPIRKFKITSAADPLADLSRLPTRLDP
jgi:hypothetical protein